LTTKARITKPSITITFAPMSANFVGTAFLTKNKRNSKWQNQQCKQTKTNSKQHAQRKQQSPETPD
jgi:hypothetical protein